MVDHRFHAFVSHTTADKPAVEKITARLEAQGLRCFLDKWDILPRDQWLRNLETGLTDSRTILIFIGTHGVGPYQQAETDVALRRQIEQRQDCIIPVLLPGASPEDISKLSPFLQGTHALRFHNLDDPLPHLILAGMVRGDDPDHLRQLIREQANAPDDLLQTLNYWLSGLHIQWQGEECHISEGRGEFCLRIPDLSASHNPDSIAYLLDWKSRLTKMFGRENELKSLHSWADAKAKISVCLIMGEGGVGKTRLAFMLAEQLKEKGWQAGEAQGLELERCWYTGSSGTLLVIDYPEQRPDKAASLLESLALMPEPARKLRILLLSRNGDFLQKLTQSTDSLVALRIELPSLAANDSASWDLFREAWRRLQELKQVHSTAPLLAQESYRQWQQKKDLHRRPLLILALTIRLMLDPNAKELGGKEIIRDLVQKYEIIRLKAEAKKLNVDEYSLVMLRAVAAISGQIESEALRYLIEASAKLNLDIKLPTLRQLKGTSLWINGSIHALQPDLLSADLMDYVLTELAGDQSGAWQYCGLEAATNTAVASSIFGRLIHDAQNTLDRPWPLRSLIDWVCPDPERCEKLASALVRNTLERTLLPLAIATNQALLAQADSPQMQAQFLNTLSIRLAASGEREAALQAIKRAVDICKQLAKENFAAFGPDLARSLNTLSNRQADNGEREAALQAIKRAVDIREQLAKENFAAYGPDLAKSLYNLSIRLAKLDKTKEKMETMAKLETLKQQILDEQIQVPASMAWLFE
ncbi:MAG: toll/interleukin-1 receptor domain-containing protein [Candidatus Nitrotoga sp.]